MLLHRSISRTARERPDAIAVAGLEERISYRQLDEATLTDEQLRPRGPVFIHTKGPHDQVPVDYFGKLVKTSSL